MAGMTTIFRKELADHLGSRRIAVISTIIILASLSAVLSAVESPTLLQQDSAALFLSLLTERSGNLPSFLFFVTFLVPILGILLGFDAINAERQRGTLSLLISQPVYRDALINGKFLAALAAMALMMGGILALIGGISMAKLGIAPNGAEILRALVFFGAAMLYASFWLSVAILFSVLFDKTSTSALAAIALWIFLAFFVQLVAGVVADHIVPVGRESPAEEV
ncbi:MAG TPA: ABC transporter permease subunit, partial [Synergistaceae bacterium]|nr:ABC transporter permease subunit [Synergistaceae bacterium]